MLFVTNILTTPYTKSLATTIFQGKHLDKSEFLESLNRGGSVTPAAPGGAARLRGRPAAARARPKTIHVDSSALHAAEGILATKQPSSTNLTGILKITYGMQVIVWHVVFD